MSEPSSEVQLKLRKLKLLEAKNNLPHLYGFPWYTWAREFFENIRDKMQLLTAANQVSKSSTMIRKCIHWSTEKDLWPRLWKTAPRQFWYLYPNADFATSEVENKWVPEFLPKNPDDAKYGWELRYKPNKKIEYIQFKSGVRVYFKTYEQDVHALQGSSVHAIFADEELPESLFSELNFRLAATAGYYHGAFTATRAQEFWREAMEEVGTPIERFKGAWKKQVSLFDCTFYEDGTASPWTEDKIRDVIASCKDQNEVLRRVYGRFVRSDGRRYVFTKDKNYKKVSEKEAFRVPDGWHLFGSIDWGSGQQGRGKSAITFTAVDPKFYYGRVILAWRGDGVSTTAGDLFDKYMALKQEYNFKPVLQVYDYSAIDFGVIAMRAGESFLKADKARTRGDELMNTLFRYDRLSVDNNGDIGNERLATELSSLGIESISDDDSADSFRYGVTCIPWDMESLAPENFKKVAKAEPKAHREGGSEPVPQVHTVEDNIEAELEDWSSMYE